jgi:hypothetical protein
MRFAHATLDIQKLNPDATLQVLAAGLPRCATCSLEVAFTKLGYGPCIHMGHIAPFVDRLKLTMAATDSTNSMAERSKAIHTLYDGFRSSSDFPGCYLLEQLLDAYPDCKVILNKGESAEAWLKSMQDAIFWFLSWKYWLVGYLIPTEYWNYRMQTSFGPIARRDYGLRDDEELFSTRLYHLHNERVKRICQERKIDLLEWQPSDGWEPICKYLGKPVPDEPFPVTNDTTMMKILMWFATIRGLLAWSALFSVPVFGWKAWQRYIG